MAAAAMYTRLLEYLLPVSATPGCIEAAFAAEWGWAVRPKASQGGRGFFILRWSDDTSKPAIAHVRETARFPSSPKDTSPRWASRWFEGRRRGGKVGRGALMRDHFPLHAAGVYVAKGTACLRVGESLIAVALD